MKKALVLTFACVAMTSVAAFGQRNKDVAKAIREQYPDATTQVIRSQVINGVKVNEVKITTKAGESTAMITESGDFLLSGMPVQPKLMPAAVNSAYSGLFKGTPQDAQRFVATSYHVQINSGGKTYDLRLDPVGRLRDINTAAEMKAADLSGTDASTSDNAKKVREIAEKRYDGAKVQEIHLYPPAGEGFYIATLTTDEGKVDVVANADGVIYTDRQELTRDKLPKPVADAVEKMFDSAKIGRVDRTTYTYYQFNTQSTGGEPVTIAVRPNGDIMSVANREAAREEDATTAASKREADTRGGKKAK